MTVCDAHAYIHINACQARTGRHATYDVRRAQRCIIVQNAGTVCASNVAVAAIPPKEMRSFANLNVVWHALIRTVNGLDPGVLLQVMQGEADLRSVSASRVMTHV